MSSNKPVVTNRNSNAPLELCHMGFLVFGWTYALSLATLDLSPGKAAGGVGRQPPDSVMVLLRSPNVGG